jgi:hypothetical protein
MRKTIGSLMWLTVVLLIAVATLTFICSSEPNIDGTALSPTGYAFAIGLNEVDLTHYTKPVKELHGCEADAVDMNEIASSQGLKAKALLGKEATRDKVLDELSTLAKNLKQGDLLVVSYSGHGANVPDKNGDEADGLDETWCLYDGELLDDELYGAWMKFQAGVRILIFSDSCHSGTVLRMKKLDAENPDRIRELDKIWQHQSMLPKLEREKMLSLPEIREAIRKRPYLQKRIRNLRPVDTKPKEFAPTEPAEPEAEELFVARSIPPGVWRETYYQNKSFYDKLGEAAPREDSGQVKASVILISACEDLQKAHDAEFNGLFTWKLKKVWNKGAFTGDHLKFYEDIRERVRQMDPNQVPQFRYIGPFVEQRPYTVK